MSYSPIFDHVPSSISFSIWATAFLQGRETLERSVDSIALAPRIVNILGKSELLTFFLSELRKNSCVGIRCHLPVSGNTDSLIGNDEFVELALTNGQALTTTGGSIYGITESEDFWDVFPRNKEPIKSKYNWKDLDHEFHHAIQQVSQDLEAFDLIKDNQEARDLLIDLDHDISKQVYPDDQDSRVTFLIGRSLRVLTTCQFVTNHWLETNSATKSNLVRERILELARISRLTLTTAVNYGIN
ncbi:MAG: hypothetical protein ACO3XH_00035 [Candidatus Nanopelagicales bacterium]